MASLLFDIVLGIIGAIAGAWLFGTFSRPGVSTFTVYSVGVTVTAALMLLLFYYAFRRDAAKDD